jgi:hypothetical protein
MNDLYNTSLSSILEYVRGGMVAHVIRLYGERPGFSVICTIEMVENAILVDGEEIKNSMEDISMLFVVTEADVINIFGDLESGKEFVSSPDVIEGIKHTRSWFYADGEARTFRTIVLPNSMHYDINLDVFVKLSLYLDLWAERYAFDVMIGDAPVYDVGYFAGTNVGCFDIYHPDVDKDAFLVSIATHKYILGNVSVVVAQEHLDSLLTNIPSIKEDNEVYILAATEEGIVDTLINKVDSVIDFEDEDTVFTAEVDSNSKLMTEFVAHVAAYSYLPPALRSVAQVKTLNTLAH